MDVAKSMTSSFSSSSFCSIEDVQVRLKRLLQENANLRNTLQQNNLYMSQLKDTLLHWQSEVTKLQEENRKKSVEARELVTKLRNQNDALKQRLTENGIPFTDLESLADQSKPDSSLTESSELGSFIVIAEEPSAAEKDGLKNNIPTVDPVQSHEEGKTDSLCSQLQQENELLRAELRAEFERSKKDRKLLNETQAQFDELFISHEKLSQQLTELSVSQSSMKQSSSNFAELFKQADEKCGSLTARLSSAENLLIAKQQEITQLHNELKSLRNEVETIPALRAQAEVYSADFEAERRAREQLAAEKDDLAQQLRLLRQQQQQPRAAQQTGQQQQQQFECPLCNMVFTTLPFLENHMEACLNNDTGMYP